MEERMCYDNVAKEFRYWNDSVYVPLGAQVVRVWGGHYQVRIFIIPTWEIWVLEFQPLTNACFCITLQRTILISGSSTYDGLTI